MAYITKRGSSYSVRYTYQDEHGKSCDKWESFPTKEEAVKRQKEIEHELATGNFLIPSTVTVAEFLMDWLPKQCSKHKWAPKTYQSNLALIQNLIIPYIGEMQMQKLRPYHIEALYDTLSKIPCGQYVGGKRRDLSPKQQKRTLSGTTLHEVHQLLHNSFLLAVEWGILIKKPRPSGSAQKVPEMAGCTAAGYRLLGSAGTAGRLGRSCLPRLRRWRSAGGYGFPCVRRTWTPPVSSTRVASAVSLSSGWSDAALMSVPRNRGKGASVWRVWMSACTAPAGTDASIVTPIRTASPWGGARRCTIPLRRCL